MRIVGLGGSLQVPSTSLTALQMALQGASADDVDIDLLDLRTLDLPLYGSAGTDAAGLHPGVSRLVRAAASADAMIWSAPMYHGTVSGSFKNSLDWLEELAGLDPPFLTDKPVGLIATAAGAQALQAINSMEFAVRALRGWVVPFVVPVNGAHDVFRSDERPTDRAVVNRLVSLGGMVLDAARRFATEAASPRDPVIRAGIGDGTGKWLPTTYNHHTGVAG
ncbi:NADPH-dependent FMN reductase [Nonomuraea sp. CA-141351]|uniref:NADPH-dependent FMN reductase n=1 Tax=Nonomuraea sp. CA-141351 TaxID=3239996 RepID=UPI003D948501